MKNLSDYTKQVTNIDIPSFPFDDDKLRSIIENCESRPGSKKPFINKTGAIIMGTLGVTTIIIMSLLFGGGEKINNTAAQYSKTANSIPTKQSAASSSSLSYKQEDEPDVKSMDKNRREQLHKDDEDTNSDIERAIMPDNEKPTNLKNYLRKIKEISFEIIPFPMSKEDFRKLNVNIENNSINILTESLFDNKSENSRALSVLGYPDHGISRKEYIIDSKLQCKTRYIDYGGWSMDSSLLVSPVYLYTYKLNVNSNPDSFKIAFDNSPLLDNDANRFLEKELEETTLFYVNTLVQSCLRYGFDSKLILRLSSEQYPLMRYFSPFYYLENDNKDTLIVVMWYPTTRELLKALPAGLSDQIRKTRKITDYVSVKDLKYPTKENDRNSKSCKAEITGIESLNLTTEELQRIGIEIDGNRLVVPFESMLTIKGVPDSIKYEVVSNGYDPNLDFILMKESMVMDNYDIERKVVDYSGWDHSNFSMTKPIMITGKGFKLKWGEYNVIYEVVSDFSPLLDSSRKIMNWGDWDGETYKPVINKLLPVHITVGDSSSKKKNYNEYNVWFVVTDEFADLLPDRYRIPIKKELEIMKAIESGEIDIEDACNLVKSYVSYFGLCRNSSGLIKDLTVVPNPAKDIVTVEMTLLKDTQLTFDLYDYKGAHLTILKSGSFNAGVLNEKIVLPDLREGVYMILVTDEQGSQVVQKLIICK